VSYDAAGMRVEDQGQYYGRGYSQAQSGYSSSGYGKINFLLPPISIVGLNSKQSLFFFYRLLKILFSSTWLVASSSSMKKLLVQLLCST